MELQQQCIIYIHNQYQSTFSDIKYSSQFHKKKKKSDKSDINNIIIILFNDNIVRLLLLID